MTFSPLIRFVAIHALVGWLIGVAVTALVYFTDFANLGTLIDGSETGWIIIVMSIIFLGSTFSGVQIAVALYLRSE